ncbi:cobyrinic acid a,c-diamide synthase [Kluyvera cryocrescens]|uniref:Cobyrinic acid a,c-diamide synthase n=1 Tax=Kluyvera cryocrescens TaxID=580 RepID=A0A485B3K5_KLUCR|nr:cobyrinic acid a,c-diamide synthase [Kluyvera cryocrescens]
MYLGSTLEDAQGEIHAMADILPGASKMGKRLTRFGYCEAQAERQTLLAAPGEVLRGMNSTTPILPHQLSPVMALPQNPRWCGSPAVARRLAERQYLRQLLASAFFPAPRPCSTTGLLPQGARNDAARLVFGMAD